MPATLTLTLAESTTFAASPAGVDPVNGVVRDVKVLGKSSKNGRDYADAALADVAKLAENAQVFVNHADVKFAGRRAPRNVEDLFGRLVGCYRTRDGVFAKELRFNPRHPIAEQFAWAAEHDPADLGLSINGHSTVFTRRPNGEVLVERVEQIFSVDLVVSPATVGGLYEQVRYVPPPRERTVAEIKILILNEPVAPSAYERGVAFADQEQIKDRLLGIAEQASPFDRAVIGMIGQQLRGEPLIPQRTGLDRVKKALLA